MSDLQPKNAASELDLGDIVREIYRWKWPIALFVLVVGATAAVMALRTPNTYASEGALIIRQPQDPMAGEIQPLSVETLKKLTDSTDVKWVLFEKLWKDQALAKWKSRSLDMMSEFRDFQQSLSSELIKEESRGSGGSVSLLPVLELQATARSPEEAQTIANEWVDIVASRSQSIYMQGIQDLDVFIGDVYLRANENLVDKEMQLAMSTSEADLDLKRSKFDTIRNKAIEFESDIFELDVEIRTNEVMINEITQRLQDREHDGIWLGDAGREQFIEGKRDFIDVENAAPVAQRILKTVGSLVDKNEELQELTTSSRLEVKEGEAQSLQDSLLQASNEISNRRLMLSQSVQELENVEQILSEQEVNGVWIGEMLSQHYRQAAMLPEPLKSVLPVDSAASSAPASVAPAAATAEPTPSTTLDVGFAASENTASTPAPTAQSEESEWPAIPKPPLTEQTHRIDAAVRDLVQRELALLAYQQEAAIDTKKTQLAFVEEQLKTNISAEEAARKSLLAGETRLAYLKPELNSQPPKLSLDKAITDDVLWQEYLNGDTSKSISTPLKTELLNPAHQRAQELVMELTAETESLKQEIGFLNQRKGELETEADTLRAETALIAMELKNRQEGIDAQRSVLGVMAKSYTTNKEKRENLLLENRQMEELIESLEISRDEVYVQYREVEEDTAKIRARIDAKLDTIDLLESNLDMMANDYQAERARLETLYLDQIRSQAERDLKEDILESATEESELLQEDIAHLEQSLKLEEREVTKLEGVRSTLATRAEEVALLTVTAEKASRSGVVVLYNAQLNPLKVGPARTKSVAISMVAAFILSCVAVFVVKTLKNEF